MSDNEKLKIVLIVLKEMRLELMTLGYYAFETIKLKILVEEGINTIDDDNK